MKIVGISACPAGLAHTPMAAKALEKAQAADFVIIASDQKIVGMDRFEGKKVIRVDINICIKAPEAVLKKCVAAVSK